METMTLAPVTEWHVYVGGEWVTAEYDGYAPVSVRVGDRLQPVTYRHMARGCTRAVCAGIHADAHAQYGAAQH